MTKQVLLQKLDALIDEAARSGLWGSLEILFQDGRPTVLREVKTQKLEGTTHAPKTYR